MLILAKLLKALHSDAGPWQLAFGIMLGMMMGLTPFYRLHNILILFIVLFFRVNLATFLLSFGVFSILAFLLDPLMMGIGEALLVNEGLSGLWTALYNTGIGRLSQFYNTLTIGSLLFSILLAPFVLFASKILIIQYRKRFLAWIEKLKVIQFIKGSRVYQIFQGLGG